MGQNNILICIMISSKIPTQINDSVKKLTENGFEAYLVGGCVRDLILNRNPKDWDLTTNAKPEEIMALFPEHVYENNFGTVGIKTNSENPALKIIEITPYRIESRYSNSRHPDKIQFGDSLNKDLQRRDFTMNAIAYDLFKGQIVDPYGGQKDIKDMTIRTVGNPNERFAEDSLRMLRAIRFAAELGFTIDIETMCALSNNIKLMENVSRERIKEEFTKIIMSDNPMIALNMAERLGVLSYISPIFEKMIGVKQNKDAHKYDVWEHSLRTLQYASDKGYELETRLAALFHDIAKPETKREQSGKTTFYGHEVIGSRIARETLRNLTYSNEIVEKVSKLVRWHMFFSDTEEITLSAVRRLIMRVGKENIWDLINLRKCDRIGTGRPKEQPYRLRKFQSMIDEVMRDPISVKMLKLNGKIMLNELHMKPGPKIGHILHALLEEVLDDPTKNNLKYQKERALELEKFNEKDLIELGARARESKERAEERELAEIKQNRFVK